MALPNAPQSRNEKYLAKIAGQEVELPNEPLSREEQYLDYIAKNGGGGGGYTLPTATASRLGGIKVGSGLNVEEDGTLSTDGGGGISYRPIDFNSVVGGGRSTQSIADNAFTCAFDDTYPDWSINILALTDSVNLTDVDKIKLSCISDIFSGEALIRLYITTVNTYTRGEGSWSTLLSDTNISAQLEITEDGDYEVDTSDIIGVRYIYVVALTGLNQGQQGRCDDTKLGAFDGTLVLSKLSTAGVINDYNDLDNQPSVNGVTLYGNKTASDLGLVAAPVVNLNNGMVSHSTDSSYITVDLDVPLTTLKQYSVTLKDPSSNYIETLKVLWNGTMDVVFPGNASTSGTFGLKLMEETVQLFNYGGMWRDIYCTIEEAGEDEHELKTLHLSSDSTDGNGVRGTGLNIEDVVIVGVSSGDSSSDLMWNLGMKNVSGGKHEYTIRFFRPSGELCANMNFWADVFYYEI